MGQKPVSPEVPVAAEHLEHPVSIGKQQIALGADIGRTWSREVVKVDEKTRQKNPLAGLSKEQLLADVEAFAQGKNLDHILDDLKKRRPGGSRSKGL